MDKSRYFKPSQTAIFPSQYVDFVTSACPYSEPADANYSLITIVYYSRFYNRRQVTVLQYRLSRISGLDFSETSLFLHAVPVHTIP